MLGFTNHSFSANVVRLLHSLPIFEGQNGTVYLDGTASSHKCHADGGLHEFFNLGRHAGKLEHPCVHCCRCSLQPYHSDARIRKNSSQACISTDSSYYLSLCECKYCMHHQAVCSIVSM